MFIGYGEVNSKKRRERERERERENKGKEKKKIKMKKYDTRFSPISTYRHERECRVGIPGRVELATP